MHPISFIPLLLLSSLTLAPTFAAAQHDHSRVSLTGASSPAEAEVRATLEALFQAAERNDLAALDTLYAGDSLTVIEGAGIDRGWTNYRDHHLAPELKDFQDFQYRPTEIEAHVSGDLAWAIFRYTLKARVGERTIDNVGRGTAVLERRDGRWIVRHTQTTSRARRPSDPA
jgi:uncharacterized protein (TIGR02246 family)